MLGWRRIEPERVGVKMVLSHKGPPDELGRPTAYRGQRWRQDRCTDVTMAGDHRQLSGSIVIWTAFIRSGAEIGGERDSHGLVGAGHGMGHSDEKIRKGKQSQQRTASARRFRCRQPFAEPMVHMFRLASLAR